MKNRERNIWLCFRRGKLIRHCYEYITKDIDDKYLNYNIRNYPLKMNNSDYYTLFEFYKSKKQTLSILDNL
jgi:hypothetical protein